MFALSKQLERGQREQRFINLFNFLKSFSINTCKLSEVRTSTTEYKGNSKKDFFLSTYFLSNFKNVRKF